MTVREAKEILDYMPDEATLTDFDWCAIEEIYYEPDEGLVVIC